jgi:hypothetical protein
MAAVGSGTSRLLLVLPVKCGFLLTHRWPPCPGTLALDAEMQQRRVVLVCNLKPANMRGIQSQAMVLAATAPDGSKVSVCGGRQRLAWLPALPACLPASLSHCFT